MTQSHPKVHTKPIAWNGMGALIHMYIQAQESSVHASPTIAYSTHILSDMQNKHIYKWITINYERINYTDKIND